MEVAREDSCLHTFFSGRLWTSAPTPTGAGDATMNVSALMASGQRHSEDTSLCRRAGSRMPTWIPICLRGRSTHVGIVISHRSQQPWALTCSILFCDELLQTHMEVQWPGEAQRSPP